jgi:hypothetical protein
LAANITGGITEKLVTAAWQDLVEKGGRLRTESGDTLQVIYPGKTSDLPGSDFQGAVIRVKRRTFKGNIELHVNASDWHKHEHDRNPAYNGVVLHVAWRRDCGDVIALQNGTIIPSVTLANYQPDETARLTPCQLPCAGAALKSPEKLNNILAEGGSARFREKATQFQKLLQAQTAGQVLFAGIMKALGYARNQAPFQTLAERIPLSELESVLNQTGREALLLGTAGLLPSQRPECEYSPFEDYVYVNELEQVWEKLERADVMDYRDWQFFRVRPANSPLRRIVGMSRLLRCHREKGLLAGLVDLVGAAPTINSGHFLAEGLMASDDGYWSGRFDFGKGFPGLSPWLIGQTRADDIVINVLLPFVYAWGQNNCRIKLAETAFALFGTYPPVETNTVERHMRLQFGLRGSQVNSAQRQQGLLHYYKKWCTQGRCRDCELNKK